MSFAQLNYINPSFMLFFVIEILDSWKESTDKAIEQGRQ